jgi:predicted secreted protein
VAATRHVNRSGAPGIETGGASFREGAAVGRLIRTLVATLALLGSLSQAGAQTTILDVAPTSQPIVSITASATSNVANDRMHAFLRAEAEHADAAQAASDVNARMGRALSRARAVTGVEATTAGYSSYQITEPNRPPRWRVSQTLVLESGDFAALSGLVSRLQGTDGLLLSGLHFSVSAPTRRAAEDALTQQAIRNWRDRAETAAKAFGAGGWRTGRVTVQTNDYGRPQPMFRSSAGAAAASAPVTVEGGMSDVTVTVSGEAILDTVRAPR